MEAQEATLFAITGTPDTVIEQLQFKPEVSQFNKDTRRPKVLLLILDPEPPDLVSMF